MTHHAELTQGLAAIGLELTPEQINAIWMAVQHESLGSAIEFGPGYETFWTYIPHFIHSPFYVYAYAFGDCLVNSLYARYRESEQGFQEKYFAMLKAGGTKHHSELLAPFGLDAREPAFWLGGLGVIALNLNAAVVTLAGLGLVLSAAFLQNRVAQWKYQSLL